MFEKLPSLLRFQPKFYTGGPSRFHLPLFYDLVACGTPKRIVVLGFSDGQAGFTFCQASREQGVESQCTLVRRDRPAENAADDLSWREGKDYGAEFYGARVRFAESAAEALKNCADRSVDLLLLDDCDTADEIRADLASWEPKLSPHALVLLHGLQLERADGPGKAWKKWVGDGPSVEMPDGIGLSVGSRSSSFASHDPLGKTLFGGGEKFEELIALHRIAATRIDAQARADMSVREQTALKTRQVWLDSLLADRWKVQAIMDEQARTIDSQSENFEILRRDRAKAQLVMDGQHEQLKHWVAETERLKAKIEQLKTQIKDQKTILSAAKQACRKGGRCFHVLTGPKERRPFGEKVIRELRRIPRNFRFLRPAKPAPTQEQTPPAAPVAPVDRYSTWINDHEPDAVGLEEQRRASKEFSMPVKFSLLTPVHNTPANFLDEMFASVAAQTYDNWEMCVVDGGSDRLETIETLRQWEVRDPRIRVQRLAGNLGISENTNHALQAATGDLLACVDHDDLLAPFALYELARAAAENPDADIFYSDEDRWSVKGKRHAPFFKPEWSPELLYSSMYLGHLTGYRRSLVDQIGGFRKEFDLSQDYDFALRATERARVIHHIPHVLYHWREHSESGSAGGKPDARKTNLAALADAMKRRNLTAEIVEYPTANRARLQIAAWPRVSVIIPTDSPTRAQACLRDLPRNTKYPDLEIVLVTNTRLLESLRTIEIPNATARFVPYDKQFNFSEKCNLGAAAATGERLIFFNDDVETTQPRWIQNLIEPLENPEVGAVGPKLLYETGQIQHAGLVMGVRDLTGTAFHQRAADSTEHFNLAQSMRNVAALSAACLAMRREDFVRVGGFDAINTPIAHSDLDLCFKVREAGLRCVYTPYATLSHAGHVSIGTEEEKEATRRRDKASIYLLKRWPRYTTHDPYFTDNMRDWLHTDSPAPLRMMASNRPAPIDSSPDLLFVSHDLSLSGAPMMLFHAAAWCQRNGIFVLVMAPEDGPLREKLNANGISVIIDPLIETGHESFARMARDFDCVIANTIRSGAIVRALKGENVPVAWWVHEPASVGEHYLREDTKLRAAMQLADMLLTPSESTATVYRRYTEEPVKCLHNAIPDPGPPGTGGNGAGGRPLRFLLLGSVEPRKGQDTFVKALASLPAELQQAARFEIAGRVLDPDFWPKVEAVAAKVQNFSAKGALSHAEAMELMREADVVVCASRDEAMPMTILEAMSLGKALIATIVGGALEVLVEGENALLVRPDAPDALAAAIRRLIEDPELATDLGKKAHETYEKHFTMERFGNEFRELIAATISQSDPVGQLQDA